MYLFSVHSYIYTHHSQSLQQSFFFYFYAGKLDLTGNLRTHSKIAFAVGCTRPLKCGLNFEKHNATPNTF